MKKAVLGALAGFGMITAGVAQAVPSGQSNANGSVVDGTEAAETTGFLGGNAFIVLPAAALLIGGIVIASTEKSGVSS